jgi:hypothetical protein
VGSSTSDDVPSWTNVGLMAGAGRIRCQSRACPICMKTSQ